MSDTSTAIDTTIKIASPNLWKVIFHNDEFTPVDFVAALLIKIYHKSREDAIKLTEEIHEKDKAVIGIYTKEIATTKVELTVHTALSYNFPLLATAEKA